MHGKQKNLCLKPAEFVHKETLVPTTEEIIRITAPILFSSGVRKGAISKDRKKSAVCFAVLWIRIRNIWGRLDPDPDPE
jgi:hypothetical protein